MHTIDHVEGNEQERMGNISDLIYYIDYHNLSVSDSKISSIFDYLYSHCTSERMAFLTQSTEIFQNMIPRTSCIHCSRTL